MPLGARQASRRDNPGPYCTGRIPSDVRRSTLVSLQVPMTSAPPSRASWAAYRPTPPAAADTTMVSPGCGFTAATDAHAVAPAPAIVAAASHDSPAGLAATASTLSATYSACAARGTNPRT